MPGPEKFPRRERLTRKREFQDAFKCGKKVIGRAFVCYVVRREGQGRKLGLAVSRKVGGAVVRNRVKRYLREIYRVRRSRLAKDINIVVVARPSSAALSYSECEDAIDRLFRKGDALHE